MGRHQREENRQRRIATDDAVAEQQARERVAAQRRFDLDSWYRAFLDPEPRITSKSDDEALGRELR